MAQCDVELGQAGGVGQGPADHPDGFSWLTVFGFSFLTFNSGMAIYRSNGDLGSIAFVAGSYVDLVLLFVCLRVFESVPRDSHIRQRVKAAVWLLTTLLTAVFSYKVGTILPPPLAILVLGITAAVVTGGYYAFFHHQEHQP